MKVRCIQRVRNNSNRITGYVIQREDGKMKSISPENLKQKIKSGSKVENLILTSDNRLIFKEKVSNLNTAGSKEVTITRDMIVQIDKKVAELGKNWCNWVFKSCISKEELGKIKVKKGVVQVFQQDGITAIYEKYTNKIVVMSQNRICLPEKSYALFNVDMNTNERMLCTLGKVDVSNVDTSNVKDMSYLFAANDSSEEYTGLKVSGVSDFNTSKVVDMQGMFHLVEAENLDLSSFNTRNVENMQEMFSYCKSRGKLDLSSFDTFKVKSMKSMFAFCSANGVDLSKFNTIRVKDMSYMFNESDLRGDLDLRNFDTGVVEDMSHMFEGCRVNELNISTFDTGNVRCAKNMFWGCEAKVIKVGMKWNLPDSVFKGCNARIVRCTF